MQDKSPIEYLSSLNHSEQTVALQQTYLIGEIMLVDLGIVFHVRERPFQREKVYR